MRIPLTPRDQLTPEQKPFYDDMVAGIDAHLKGFVSRRADGALVGPFNPMLQFPQWGVATWDYIKALIEHSKLPKPIREIAILVTGSRFRSRYELYAHEHVADIVGLSDAKQSSIVAGLRPSDLTAEEGAAYDLSFALTRGGPLPQATYEEALRKFGEQGVAELIYLVAGYSLVSVVLNGYDVSVPDSEDDAV